ncbi:cytochrome oxidase complex assembly protein 1-domain-containing protein [Podospora didyma]|uniref:Cytochrome oxidase complex assembly protein 1-domain-containing protein n=1 Tax=Podospora didyma TaxID=330526 RepID=A0AAE0U1Q6_9PEZI|nr:cytochrome oxidase complex assembly protein 1-domain-containing protein [Podospora didyma]
MLSRISHGRRGDAAVATAAVAALLRRSTSRPATPVTSLLLQRQYLQQQRRSLISAPRQGDGPLMERRSDRELPDIEQGFRWSRTFPVFILLVGLSTVAIFNYQKLSSPVVSSTLYALRTNAKARTYLGDEIYFAQQIPWISGEMNMMKGKIDITFKVKGTRSTGVMRFASNRPTSRGMFETTEWSLETAEGRKIDLLDGSDPFRGITGPGEGGFGARDVVEDDEATRGFRQMSNVQK